MRKTLLEMTQDILSAMDSDEVNSISDTVESLQVAKVIKQCFYDMAVDIGLTEHETVFQLNASGDSTKPCQMTVPSNVTKLIHLYYNVQDPADDFPDYRLLKYLPFHDFIMRANGLANVDDGVTADSVSSQAVVMNGENFTIPYTLDAMPTYYTTADDNLIVFDSYDNTIDSTLQKSKTMCTGMTYPAWQETDSFYPDIDPTQFPLLFNAAKVRCFSELKQQDNREATQAARRQKIVVQKRKRKVTDQAEIFKAPRYGRK